MPDFYDDLAPLYHLIHQDWDASIRRQGEQLSVLIKTEWPQSKRVLDVSCGIGTQAIGLAQHGYSVTASDISANALARAKHEARARGAHLMRSRYYAISITRLLELMRQAGFGNVRRLDNAFYQPVLVGTRPEAHAISADATPNQQWRLSCACLHARPKSS
ncbi:MAG: class I SAM-dependent methyltransferase [Steroidobacteraceae bacterium]